MRLWDRSVRRERIRTLESCFDKIKWVGNECSGSGGDAGGQGVSSRIQPVDLPRVLRRFGSHV
jgi:hypothetical protein